MAYVETRKNKNGDIVYRAQLQLDGRRLSATFERKRDARQWEAELRSRARNNKNFLSRFSDKTTVAEVIERYKCEAFRNKERLASDRGYQLDWWVEAIGNLLITEVDKRILSAQLEKLAHKRTNTGRTLSPATVNRYRAAFSVVLVRPQLMKLLEEAEAGDILLVESIDRLTRLTRDEWKKLKQMIEHKSIQIVAVDLPTSHKVLSAEEIDAMTQGILDASITC